MHNHNPVCVNCGVEMTVQKNGVVVVDHISSDNGASIPHKVWNADVFTCQICKHQVALNFGNGAFLKRSECHDFDERLKKIKTNPSITTVNNLG